MGSVNYGKNIEIRHNVDVFVGGGGPAGVTAAIAAAREGKSVFLAESMSCFGGMTTAGMVPIFMCVTDGITLLCDGLGKEIMDMANAKGCEDRIYYYIDKEALKRTYEQLICGEKIDFRFITQIIDVCVENGDIQYVVLASKSGIYAVKAKVYIDCTGDGDMCALAGAEFEKGNENGEIMPSTLCSLWDGIQWDKAKNVAQDSFIEKAYAEKIFSVCDLHLPGVWKVGKGRGGGNVGHAYNVDGTDEGTVTTALVEQRKLLVEYENYYRKYVDGFQEATIVSTGEVLGIRASRRIVGDYVLTVEDFKSRAIFYDEIGRYCYPIDVHMGKADPEAFKQFKQEYFHTYRYKSGESYGIPYRCFIPKGLNNVLVAGRCVSADNYMQGSIRVIPACYIMGQAVGTAAALCVQSGRCTRDIDVKKLQKMLVKNKAALPNFKE